MTRSEALHKLLALGPLTKDEIRQFTGWKIKDIQEAIVATILARTVTYKHGERGRVYMRAEECPGRRMMGKPKMSRAFIVQAEQPLIRLQDIFTIDFFHGYTP